MTHVHGQAQTFAEQAIGDRAREVRRSPTMAKSVPNFHGQKVYNLTSGATLPAWISDRKKREVRTP